MAAPDVTGEELRPLLFSLAYRMVGGVAEAEDLVQEAFLRFHRAPAEVEAPKAFLTTVVTRLAIDHLRSARVRREAYVGPWLPEPLVADAAPGPAGAVEDDETLSLAFLALLERLTPGRARRLRAARAVRLRPRRDRRGRREEQRRTAARSWPARAATSTRGGRASSRRGASARRCSTRFLAAARAGDVQALVDLLAADAVSYADGGGKARATLLPIYGADKVARLWARLGAAQRAGRAAPRRRQRPARRGRGATGRARGRGAHARGRGRARADGLGGGQPGQARPGPHRPRRRSRAPCSARRGRSGRPSLRAGAARGAPPL